ncbi:beta-lactamase/transpeptidase-like protein [Massariosphaeria phaeospora]|uniref:Beta-lactamase/transpeptidase-like protein n=1 Tax=Massariosphaeria phaeospora TaxID=100035 RepID=A0A7C8MGY7_9PLEO|nr:beta-lactamase/transpeptidase-like protein [Massariosphaeria phaeospora]
MAEPDRLLDRIKAHYPTIRALHVASGAPGLSLGVFHHSRIQHIAHFGRRAIDSPAAPNDDSVYGVASTFKIVTASAIAKLVADGVLGWDTPVRQYLAGLDRSDDFGRQATVRDLLANRTGLPMASFYWGQQNGEQLLDKSEFVALVNSIELVKPFRSTFIYSQWNYALLHLIVESVTGKSFGAYVQEVIFDPLGLKTPTFDVPQGTNVMRHHANRNDGSAHEITTSPFDSASGLAAGTGGKTSLRDQMHLYIALLHAYQHQTANNVDTTPNSPFTYLRTIFSPHIKFPGSTLDKQAYCLGVYRTQLPGNLSCASINSLLPRRDIPVFGAAEAPPLTEEIFHHTGNFPGGVGSMLLVPRTNSGVVVMANATPSMDAPDFIAQILLSALLDTQPPPNLPSLSRKVIQMQTAIFDQAASMVESCKTDTPPSLPLPAYAGSYSNTLGNFKIVVTTRGSGLHVSVQGKPASTYDLVPCDGDTFSWAVDRDHEVVDRGMWINPLPQFHVINFEVDGKCVRSLSWQHDRLMDAEVFLKAGEEAKSKL